MCGSGHLSHAAPHVHDERRHQPHGSVGDRPGLLHRGRSAVTAAHRRRGDRRPGDGRAGGGRQSHRTSARRHRDWAGVSSPVFDCRDSHLGRGGRRASGQRRRAAGRDCLRPVQPLRAIRRGPWTRRALGDGRHPAHQRDRRERVLQGAQARHVRCRAGDRSWVLARADALRSDGACLGDGRGGIRHGGQHPGSGADDRATGGRVPADRPAAAHAGSERGHRGRLRHWRLLAGAGPRRQHCRRHGDGRRHGVRRGSAGWRPSAGCW